MSLTNKILGALFNPLLKKMDSVSHSPDEAQRALFEKLIRHGEDTNYGREFSYHDIDSVETFKASVPIRTLSEFAPYVSLLKKNGDKILLDEVPFYFSKNLPISSDLLKENLFKGVKIALAVYLQNNPTTNLFSGKFLVKEGEIINYNQFIDGELLAILNQNIPFCLKRFISPINENRTIEREHLNQKITAIVDNPHCFFTTAKEVMATANTPYISDVWPNLEVFFHSVGDLSSEDKSYLKSINNNKEITFISNFVSPVGYLAFQDSNNGSDLRLLLNSGIFFEFLPADVAKNLAPNTICPTLSFSELKVGEPYTLVVSTAAGLWRCMLDEVVEFTSLLPHRIKILGKLAEFSPTKSSKPQPKKAKTSEVLGKKPVEKPVEIETIKVKKPIEVEPMKVEEPIIMPAEKPIELEMDSAVKEEEPQLAEVPQLTETPQPAEKIYRIKKHKAKVETTGLLFPDELF